MIRHTLVAIFFLSLISGGVQAQVPSVLHYQASLLEDEQQVDGAVAFTARIFDEETGGQALWAESRPSVAVVDGRISLLLGSETPFPGTLFDGDARYLEIEINGERLPRLRMASTAYALRAGVAAAVVAGAVDREALAADAAVTSINDVSGPLTVEGANGATVNVDPETKTITISAPGGTGGTSGIVGIQNNDGALQVVDPNGPTATINLQPGGIGTAQLADGEVATADLDDGAVTARKLADGSVTGAKLAPGAAVGGLNGLTGGVTLNSSDQSIGVATGETGIDLTLGADAAVTSLSVGPSILTGAVSLVAGEGASVDIVDDSIRITAGGTITEITAGTGLVDEETDGEVTLGLAEAGVGTAQLANGAVTADKIGPNAVNGAMIVDSTITSTDLAAGAAVNSLNGLRGELQLAAGGGATVNVDQTTGVITLSAPAADGTGILGVQNTDGALLITDPNGPTATINLQDGGIGVDQLAAGSVTAAKLAANAVSGPALDATNFADAGQVLSFAGNGQFTWVDAATGDVTGVTAGTGLAGGGTAGEVTLSVAPGGITEESLASGAVTTDKLAGSAVTSATVANNSLMAADLAPNSVGTSELNTVSPPGGGQVLGYNGTTLEWTATSNGDITGVQATGGLEGGGNSGTVTLSIADDGITAARLANGAVGTAKLANDAVTLAKLAANAVNSASVVNNSLTAQDLAAAAVTSQAIADGTVAAIDLAPGAAVTGLGNGSTTLTGAVGLRGSPNISVSRITGENAYRIAFTGDLSGAVTSVTASNGLTTLTGTTGDVELGIAEGGVGTTQIDDEAVTAAKLAANAVNSAIIANNTLTAQDLAAGAVGAGELNTGTAPTGGQVLSYDGSALAWTNVSAGDITEVDATGGLAGGGSSGSVSLSIANGGVTGPRIAAGAILGGDNVTVTRDTNSNLVIAAPAALTSAVESITASGTTLAGPLQFATTGDATLSVSGNTLTFGTSSDADNGGIASVTSDATLSGTGTSTSPLGVADGQITAIQLAADAVTASAIADGSVGGPAIALEAITEPALSVTNDPSAGQVLSSDGSTAFTWIDPSATVTTDGTTLTGDGSTGSPLSIPNEGVGSAQVTDGSIASVDLGTGAVTSAIVLNNSLTSADLGANAVGTSEIIDASVAAIDLNAGNGADDRVLTFDSGEAGGLIWTDLPTGGLTSVATDGTTITGDGDGTPLSVVAGGIGANEIATDAVGTDEITDASIAATDLNVAGTAGDDQVLAYSSTAPGGLTWELAGASASSLRFKSEVETIAGAQTLVEQLRGVRFHWTDDERPDIGLIAEEVATVFPELVTYEADGITIRGLRYAPLVGVLIEATKAQQSALDTAKETITAQQREVDALKDRLARLEAAVQSMQSTDGRP